MTSPVQIALKSTGISEIQSALKGVKQSLIDMERESVATAKEASKERIAILKGELKEKESLLKGAGQTEEKLERGFGKGVRTRGAVVGSGAFGSINNVKSASAELLNRIDNPGAKAFDLVISSLKSGIEMATHALKTFGSFLLNDIIKPEFKREGQYLQMANRSAGGLDANEAKQAAKKAVIKYNLDEDEGMKAMAIYGAHGGAKSWKDAPKALDFFAMEAKARGSSASVISQSFAGMRMPGESFEQTKKKWLAAKSIGDELNIPIEELGANAGKIKSLTSRMKGDEADKSKNLATWLNMMAPTGSTDQNLTAIKSFEKGVLGKGASSFKSAISEQDGVKVLDFNKALEIALSKSHGDVNILKKMGLGDAKAQQMITSQLPEYSKNYAAAKASGMGDKEAEAEAVKKVIERHEQLAETMASEEDDRKKAEEVMNTVNEKWESTINQMKAAIEKEIMPAASKFATDLLAHKSEIISSALTLTRAFIALAGVIAKIPVVGEAIKGAASRGGLNVIELSGQNAEDASFAKGKASGGSKYSHPITDPNDPEIAIVAAREAEEEKKLKLPTTTVGTPALITTPAATSNEKAASTPGHDALDKASHKVAGQVEKLGNAVEEATRKVGGLNKTQPALPPK